MDGGEFKATRQSPTKEAWNASIAAKIKRSLVMSGVSDILQV